jgi:hypothetical protein
MDWMILLLETRQQWLAKLSVQATAAVKLGNIVQNC